MAKTIAHRVELYRPSSGTEGICFQEAWCSRCKRDALWNGTASDPDRVDDDKLCQLIARSMANRIDEPGYPQEWVRMQDGTPVCLAFEPLDKPERCAHTVDMFTGHQG
jgi:hypothetical protein